MSPAMHCGQRWQAGAPFFGLPKPPPVGVVMMMASPAASVIVSGDIFRIGGMFWKTSISGKLESEAQRLLRRKGCRLLIAAARLGTGLIPSADRAL